MDALERAKSLRKAQTDAENRLWYYLRAKRFSGLKFKRQKLVGKYIVDFICIKLKLIIEVDGGQHLENIKYDQSRTQFFETQGFTVLRFWNHDVMINTQVVLQAIYNAINQISPHVLKPSPLTPLPQAGEGN